MTNALFTPIDIRHIHFHNRVVMPPMVRMTPSMPPEVANTGGRVTDAVVEHYRRRAAAGTGMIIVEATAVDPGGRAWPQGLLAYADEHIPDLARLSEVIHAEGAVANIQLVHAGPQASPDVIGGPPVGPSAIAASDSAPMPRALSFEDILAIEQHFAGAAARAAQAGFDAVELHAAHGYLLDTFLSTQRNQRRDEYGGSLRNRMRFLVETLRLVRATIMERVLLDCRISIFNHLGEGFGSADLAELLTALQETGIDLLHISTRGALGGYFNTPHTIGQWAKETLRVPLIVAGGLGNPADAERLIAEGHADFAAVGGAMLADPEWARHAAPPS